MKRLLILVLLCASPCWATGNAVVRACTAAAATSCTLSGTPTYGNLMISMAYRSNSATAPTTAAGWTVIKSTTGNVNAIVTAWKYSLGNETTCGTWTNATQTYCEVYGGNWITGLGAGAALGANTSGTTGSSTSISYPTFTLSNPLSTSWVICAGGAVSATNADAAPTGMTLRSGTGITNIAFSDTNGNVSSWGTQAVTVSPTGAWATACFEIVGSPNVATISPADYLVFEYNKSISNEPCTGACTATIPIPSTLTNNYLDVAFTWGYASVAPTVSNIYCNSDTGHATWTFTLNTSVLDTGDTTDKFDYYIAGVTAGCTSVSIVASSVWTNFEIHVRSFRQIATSNPVDTKVSIGGSVSYPYISPGAITPTQTGDLIYMDCTSAAMAGTTGGGSSTQLFFSGGTDALDADTYFSIGANAFIYNATAALTNKMYFAGFVSNAVCIETALKTSAGAGNAPSGIYIVASSSHNAQTGTSLNYQTYNFNAGDALLVSGFNIETANGVQWTGLTDTLGDTITSYTPHDANGGYPNWGLDCNIFAGNNMLQFTGTNASGGQFYFTEIAGLNNATHAICYDSTAGTPVTVTSGVSTTSAMPTITPSTNTGIVFAGSELGTGAFPMSNTAPSGAVFDVGQYTGQTDASAMGAGNMWGYKFNTSNSAQSWGWTNDSTNTAWNASAIALAGTQPCTFMLLGIGKC